MPEENYVSNSHGKWSHAGVPHKGWECIDIEDLGESSFICEMCESRSIRYVHYMQHSEYSDILKVGCVCAGYMEENMTRAKARDDFMKKRVSKRIRWINNKNWRISQKGNPYIESDNYIIVMKKQRNLWSALIKSKDGTFEKWIQRKYESIESAKLAAFDYLTKILAGQEIISLKNGDKS